MCASGEGDTAASCPKCEMICARLDNVSYVHILLNRFFSCFLTREGSADCNPGCKNMADRVPDNDLVHKEIVKSWLTWGFFWAILAPLLGIILSLKFNFPNFLSTEFTHSAG